MYWENLLYTIYIHKDGYVKLAIEAMAHRNRGFAELKDDGFHS